VSGPSGKKKKMGGNRIKDLYNPTQKKKAHIFAKKSRPERRRRKQSIKEGKRSVTRKDNGTPRQPMKRRKSEFLHQKDQNLHHKEEERKGIQGHGT